MNTLEQFNEAVLKTKATKSRVNELVQALNKAQADYSDALDNARELRKKLDSELDAALPEAEQNPNVVIR